MHVSRGSVALSDCHYLSKTLSSRHLAGYYLGCAMSDPVRDAVVGLHQVLDRRHGRQLKKDTVVVQQDVDAVLDVRAGGGDSRNVEEDDVVEILKV